MVKQDIDNKEPRRKQRGIYPQRFKVLRIRVAYGPKIANGEGL